MLKCGVRPVPRHQRNTTVESLQLKRETERCFLNTEVRCPAIAATSAQCDVESPLRNRATERLLFSSAFVWPKPRHQRHATVASPRRNHATERRPRTARLSGLSRDISAMRPLSTHDGIMRPNGALEQRVCLALAATSAPCDR